MIQLMSNDAGEWWVRILDGTDIVAVTTDMRATREEALDDLRRVNRVLDDVYSRDTLEYLTYYEHVEHDRSPGRMPDGRPVEPQRMRLD